MPNTGTQCKFGVGIQIGTKGQKWHAGLDLEFAGVIDVSIRESVYVVWANNKTRIDGDGVGA